MPKTDDEQYEITDEARELQKTLDLYNYQKHAYSQIDNEIAEGFSRIRENIEVWLRIYPDNTQVLLLGHKYYQNTNPTEADRILQKLELLSKKEEELKSDPIYQSKLGRMNLSQEYREIANTLKLYNKKFTINFLCIVALYASVLIIVLFFDFIPKEDIIWGFILTKSMPVFTLTLLVFWVARFFNRRIHENVHLAEEYLFRASLLEVFETLKNSVEVEYQKEILTSIMRAITENPTHALHRKKSDKIPVEILEILKMNKKI